MTTGADTAISAREARRVMHLAGVVGRPIAREELQAGAFTQVPREVALRLASAPKIALHLWLAIERHVGRHGGTHDVPQAQIYRELGWARSTYFDARRILVLLGMLKVDMPEHGPRHGAGARRRLTLVHHLGRTARRKVESTARKVRAKVMRAAGMHPDAEAALERELAKASTPATGAASPPHRASRPPGD